MAIWHVYSDGIQADIPFNTDEDKVFGWNSIAICAEIAGVRVWVSEVNDTHLHSLVQGEEGPAEHYRTTLQQRLQRQYPTDRIYLTCDLVPAREDILTKFMYVYRNCLDFYRKLPGEYPWGCGHIYFSEKHHFHHGRRVGDLSVRARCKMFKTKQKLPPEWQYDWQGRILPESFVDYEAAEQFFGSPRAFIAFLYVRKKDEADMKQEIHRKYMESRSIQDLRRTGNRYSSRLCGRTLLKAPFAMRLKVAVRMIEEGLSGRTASLAKALYLQLDDLQLLV